MRQLVTIVTALALVLAGSGLAQTTQRITPTSPLVVSISSPVIAGTTALVTVQSNVQGFLTLLALDAGGNATVLLPVGLVASDFFMGLGTFTLGVTAPLGAAGPYTLVAVVTAQQAPVADVLAALPSLLAQAGATSSVQTQRIIVQPTFTPRGVATASFQLVTFSSPPPPPPPPPPPVLLGSLEVSVNIFSALVFVNGQEQGRSGPGSALQLTGLSPGRIELLVLAQGYRAFVRNVDIRAGALAWVQVTLEPIN